MNDRIDISDLWRKFDSGISISEAEEMRGLNIAPNYTVGDYIDIMKHDGDIVQNGDNYMLHSSLRREK